jgi:hypothetical protein
MGWTGVWGGREHGAEGSMGRKGAWGGREHGAEGSMGWNGVLVWGARHTPTHWHQPPLAPSSYDNSQPAGRHLPYIYASWQLELRFVRSRCSRTRAVTTDEARQQTASASASSSGVGSVADSGAWLPDRGHCQVWQIMPHASTTNKHRKPQVRTVRRVTPNFGGSESSVLACCLRPPRAGADFRRPSREDQGRENEDRDQAGILQPRAQRPGDLKTMTRTLSAVSPTRKLPLSGDGAS